MDSKTKKILVCFCIVLTNTFWSTLSAESASVKKAEMLNEHGLQAEAKRELINVLFETADENEKAQAYYLLGNIAFTEKRLSAALNTWNTLVEKHPNSKQAELVKGKISELTEIIGESTIETINNAVALSYFRNADFWSRNKEATFTIDGSWIPRVEAAIKWYEKVIIEFPQSPAAELAYKSKIHTLLGWKDPGRYGEWQGAREDFEKYMPQILETFSSFEADFPQSRSLQAFRYQIAQLYWRRSNYEKVREWLNLIISISGDSDSFYKDLAQWRLENLKGND